MDLAWVIHGHLGPYCVKFRTSPKVDKKYIKDELEIKMRSLGVIKRQDSQKNKFLSFSKEGQLNLKIKLFS